MIIYIRDTKRATMRQKSPSARWEQRGAVNKERCIGASTIDPSQERETPNNINNKRQSFWNNPDGHNQKGYLLSIRRSQRIRTRIFLNLRWRCRQRAMSENM